MISRTFILLVCIVGLSVMFLNLSLLKHGSATPSGDSGQAEPIESRGCLKFTYLGEQIKPIPGLCFMTPDWKEGFLELERFKPIQNVYPNDRDGYISSVTLEEANFSTLKLVIINSLSGLIPDSSTTKCLSITIAEKSNGHLHGAEHLLSAESCAHFYIRMLRHLKIRNPAYSLIEKHYINVVPEHLREAK